MMRRLNMFYIFWLIVLIVIAIIGIARSETAMIHSFNSGEMTGELGARADVRKWYSGARTMENFYCQTHGGASKRPGTYYITETSDSSAISRLIGFDGPDGAARVLEFGDKTIRFYKE